MRLNRQEKTTMEQTFAAWLSTLEGRVVVLEKVWFKDGENWREDNDHKTLGMNRKVMKATRNDIQFQYLDGVYAGNIGHLHAVKAGNVVRTLEGFTVTSPAFRTKLEYKYVREA